VIRTRDPRHVKAVS